MGALPRPALSPGPHRELVDALHSLHHRAGWPSLRHLAAQTGVSHTTVSKALSSPALPTWGVVELLVEALGGDLSSAHELWLAASSPDPTSYPEVRVAGRRDELSAVRRHAESGTGLLLVTGEAGIGKSTLVEAALAPVDVLVVVGHCLPLSREMPLMPIVDALRVIHELDGGKWMEEAFTQCPDYVRHSIARLLPELDPEAAAPPDDPWGIERLLTSITSTLRALGALRPVVLQLEDCHWADRSTLDLLTQMASVPSEPPVVVTWRTGDPDVGSGHSEWLSRIRWASRMTSVDLGPLTLEETAEQLRLLRGTTDDELAARIQARTRGLPLYTAQLAANPDEEGLPRHLADLLDRRIGELDDQTWRVARVLGLAQRRVAPEILRGATALAADAVDDALRVLAGRRLLRSGGGNEAELAHPLLVDAIERRLVPGEGAEVHARIAEALSSAAGIQPGEIADHWRAAGRPDREVACRAAAARRANEQFAYQEALEGWLRVLALWDTGHRDDVELWDVLARALEASIELGDLDGGRALAIRAESLELPDRQRVQVLQWIGSLMYERGEVARAEELLTESLQLLEQLTDSRDLLIRVLEQHFWMFLQSGRFIEAERVLTRSLDLFDGKEDSGPRRRTLAGLMWLTMYTTGDVEASLAIASRVAEAELAEPDPIADLMIAACATDILLSVPSSATRAELFARQALREAEDWGLQLCYPAVLVRGNLCQAHLLGGDTRAAAEWIRPITRTAPGSNTAFAHVMLAAVELREGNSGAALERCRAADAEMRNRNDNWAEAVPWVAEVELWTGDLGAAADLLTAALDTRLTSETAGRSGPLLVPLARARADLLDGAGADLAHRHSAGRGLRELVSRARTDPFAGGTVDCAIPALAASWQAELSRVEAAATVEGWVRAATAWDDIARPHDAAYCRWRGAQVALDGGQGTLAARLLRRAAADAHQHVPLREAIAATARRA
jgi:tetratricopeptide (TPR) repeat protein